MVVGIWSGDSKPPLNDYLMPLINELKGLIEDGIIVNGNTISIQFGWCLCDTVARCFIKSMYICTLYTSENYNQSIF